jgi:hypothetical protein
MPPKKRGRTKADSPATPADVQPQLPPHWPEQAPPQPQPRDVTALPELVDPVIEAEPNPEPDSPCAPPQPQPPADLPFLLEIWLFISQDPFAT